MYNKENINKLNKLWPNTWIHSSNVDEQGNIKPSEPLPKFNALPSIHDEWIIPFIVLSVATIIGYMLYNI